MENAFFWGKHHGVSDEQSANYQSDLFLLHCITGEKKKTLDLYTTQQLNQISFFSTVANVVRFVRMHKVNVRNHKRYRSNRFKAAADRKILQKSVPKLVNCINLMRLPLRIQTRLVTIANIKAQNIQQ